MIQQKEISRMAARYRVRDTQIEKDYILTWLLFGIAKQPFLREALAPFEAVFREAKRHFRLV